MLYGIIANISHIVNKASLAIFLLLCYNITRGDKMRKIEINEMSDKQFFIFIHIIIVPAVVLYYLFLNFAFGSTCALNRITGLMCPLCGMTRAHLAAFRLDFEAAFSYNALFPLGVPFLITLFYYPWFAKKFGKWFKWLPITMGALLTIYCIVRQIFGF